MKKIVSKIIIILIRFVYLVIGVCVINDIASYMNWNIFIAGNYFTFLVIAVLGLPGAVMMIILEFL